MYDVFDFFLTMLYTGYRLLLKSTRNLQPSSLEEICLDYQQLKFPYGEFTF